MGFRRFLVPAGSSISCLGPARARALPRSADRSDTSLLPSIDASVAAGELKMVESPSRLLHGRTAPRCTAAAAAALCVSAARFAASSPTAAATARMPRAAASSRCSSGKKGFASRLSSLASPHAASASVSRHASRMASIRAAAPLSPHTRNSSSCLLLLLFTPCPAAATAPPLLEPFALQPPLAASSASTRHHVSTVANSQRTCGRAAMLNCPSESRACLASAPCVKSAAHSLFGWKSRPRA
mmetsp:Transcript_7244/g.21884  ORF Transcript_7244/g.21884 Transcript_7244/m.21884 type:complete len:242 (+) Transcript_7244:957-1682(+)